MSILEGQWFGDKGQRGQIKKVFICGEGERGVYHSEEMCS